jgi:3-oxo-4-pregnene-20-carboxyl-CoA dehydrogenase beta subunit
MFVDLTPDQRALRAELRDYFAGLMTPAERAELLTERHGAVYRDVVRRMGRAGWLGVGWPVRWGGRGFGQVEQQIFADEAARADVPLPAVTLQTVGPTLQEHGTPWQQDFFLPKILAGEVHFAIGYTEPEAGTDLASLRTRAVRDGGDYVVDGQKIFTTGAHAADYIWLACRTAPSRHKGITILIVDTADPGFSWTPIITHDGAHHVNATYYAGVRVPVRMRVGAENEGWRLITTQLNHERVMLGPAGRIAALHDRVRAWAADRALLTEPDLRRALARACAVMRVNELLNWQVASSGGLGPAAAGGQASRVVPRGANGASSPVLNVADASATKVFSSEQLQVIGQELAEAVGRHADPAEPDTAALLTWLDTQLKRNTVLTFGGGVNEVQRELIATAGLGLPRAPRGGDWGGRPPGTTQ